MLSLQRDERKHSHRIPFSVAKKVLGTIGTILLSRTGTFVDATLSKELQNFMQLPITCERITNQNYAGCVFKF